MEAAGRSMFRHEEQKMAVPKSIVGENLVIKRTQIMTSLIWTQR